MEPLSILSATAGISAVAGKAWELGSFIRVLCQGAKNVDGRVRRLESAITELARACEHVHGQFGNMSSGSSSKGLTLVWDESKTLVKSILRQVKDCRKTLSELEKVLKDLKPGSVSFFRRVSRHMKLQDRGPQVDDFSARIKTHTDALHMSLQIVTIKIALATPDFLLQRLLGALEDLRVRSSRIQNSVASSTSRVDLGKDHEIGLLKHARDAIRHGTTLYKTSIAGSVTDAEPIMDRQQATRINEWAANVGVFVHPTHVPTGGSGDTVPSTSTSTPQSEASADRSPEAQSASDPGTEGIVLAGAVRDARLAGVITRAPLPDPRAGESGDPLTETRIAAIDEADHIVVDKNQRAELPLHRVTDHPDEIATPPDDSRTVASSMSTDEDAKALQAVAQCSRTSSLFAAYDSESTSTRDQDILRQEENFRISRMGNLPFSRKDIQSKLRREEYGDSTKSAALPRGGAEPGRRRLKYRVPAGEYVQRRGRQMYDREPRRRRRDDSVLPSWRLRMSL